MLRDMLAHALAGQPGVELMSEPPLPARKAAATSPDVIIVGAEDEGSAATLALLRRWPHSRVLLISSSGRRASLLELQPRRTALGEVSLVQLLQVVTQSAGQETG
jgi:hypothetical protein